VLEGAIDRMTRALGSAADDVIPDLVAERRAMRVELEELRPKGLSPINEYRGTRVLEDRDAALFDDRLQSVVKVTDK
jgi:hypothetical protein